MAERVTGKPNEQPSLACLRKLIDDPTLTKGNETSMDWMFQVEGSPYLIHWLTRIAYNDNILTEEEFTQYHALSDADKLAQVTHRNGINAKRNGTSLNGSQNELEMPEDTFSSYETDIEQSNCELVFEVETEDLDLINEDIELLNEELQLSKDVIHHLGKDCRILRSELDAADSQRTELECQAQSTRDKLRLIERVCIKAGHNVDQSNMNTIKCLASVAEELQVGSRLIFAHLPLNDVVKQLHFCHRQVACVVSTQLKPGKDLLNQPLATNILDNFIENKTRYVFGLHPSTFADILKQLQRLCQILVAAKRNDFASFLNNESLSVAKQYLVKLQNSISDGSFKIDSTIMKSEVPSYKRNLLKQERKLIAVVNSVTSGISESFNVKTAWSEESALTKHRYKYTNELLKKLVHCIETTCGIGFMYLMFLKNESGLVDEMATLWNGVTIPLFEKYQRQAERQDRLLTLRQDSDDNCLPHTRYIALLKRMVNVSADCPLQMFINATLQRDNDIARIERLLYNDHVAVSLATISRQRNRTAGLKQCILSGPTIIPVLLNSDMAWRLFDIEQECQRLNKEMKMVTGRNSIARSVKEDKRTVMRKKLWMYFIIAGDRLESLLRNSNISF